MLIGFFKGRASQLHRRRAPSGPYHPQPGTCCPPRLYMASSVAAAGSNMAPASSMVSRAAPSRVVLGA